MTDTGDPDQVNEISPTGYAKLRVLIRPDQKEKIREMAKMSGGASEAATVRYILDDFFKRLEKENQE